MKRDWDVIRTVLTEIEELPKSKNGDVRYGIGPEFENLDQSKGEHALLLRRSGFIDGREIKVYGGTGLASPELTWEGHDLLNTIRSNDLWEKIKAYAKDKGIELTFSAVKTIGTHLLQNLMS